MSQSCWQRGGGYTIVKDYVREHRRHRREMFVPLTHPPGHAQADFGEAWAVIAGVKQKVHFFAFDLPQSDASYVRAGSVAKFGRSGELSASAGVRGWRMNDFKGRHFDGEIVLWAVRWYCRYAVSYRDLEAMMTEPASCITFLSEQAFAPQNTRFWSRRRVWFQFPVGEDKPPMLSVDNRGKGVLSMDCSAKRSPL